MVLRNALRLLQVFQDKGLYELNWHFGGLDQSRNHIDAIETYVGVKDAFEVISNNGIVSKLDKIANSNKGIVVDKQHKIFRSEVKV